MQLDEKFIENWHLACTNGVIINDDGVEELCDGLDYEQHINSFHKDPLSGVRSIWIEDGMYTYRPDGYILCETDGDMEREIIDYFEECGIEFIEDED